jgi:hypothetical protein
MECPEFYSRQGEFVISDDCVVPVVAAQIADVVTVLAVVASIISMVVLLLVHNTKRPRINSGIIVWTIIEQFFMMIRPSLSLIGWHPTTFWVTMVVHASTAMMCSVLLLFMYLELKLLLRGSLKSRGRSLRSTQCVIGTMIAVEAALFMVSPVVCATIGLPGNVAFWVPVIAIDFTAIPYFSFLGISIHRKISRLEQHKKTSRRLLTVIIICSVLGVFTGCAGVVAVIVDQVDWIIVRLGWLAAIAFNQLIFISLVRRS